MKSLWFGDTHFPFTSLSACNEIINYCKYFKPDVIGQIGDFYDQYSFSNFAHIRVKFTAEQEMRKARKMGEQFWEMLRTNHPKARLILKTGNHDARLMKRVLENMPNLAISSKVNNKVEHLINIKAFYKFDGVETDYDYTNETLIDNYLVLHGFKQKGEHLKYYCRNVVVGHLHLGGVDFMRHYGKTIWELNCGFLGNINSLAFRYGDYKTKNWTLGFGTVDDCGPRFIAL